jgi:ligand-binding sensor domain-containing protein
VPKIFFLLTKLPCFVVNFRLRIFQWVLLMKKKQYLLIFFLYTILPLLAQDYDFDILSVESGLSQSSVICITQDHKGFIWIGTRDGLNRYDGFDVEVYRKIPFDSASLVSNNIAALLAEPGGLWIGTDNGLQWYNFQTKKFENIKLIENEKPNFITTIFQDNFGDIWIGTNNGFYSVKRDKTQNKFITNAYLHNTENEFSDSLSFRIRTFLHDSQNRFWIASTKGLFRFEFDSDRNLIIEKDLLTAPKRHITDPRNFTAILEHSDGNIYGSIGNEIHHYSEEETKFNSFSILENVNHRPAAISQLSQFSESKIVATTPSGLRVITLKNKEIVSSQLLNLPSKGVSDIRDRINFFHPDNIYKDLYWLATDIGGVVKMSRKRKQFNTQLLKDIPAVGINNPYLRHIAADDNHIWYSLGPKLVIENRRDQTFQFFENSLSADNTKSNTSISFIFLTQEGKILAGLGDEILELWIDEKGRKKSKSFPLESQCIEKTSTIFETAKHFILGGIEGNISILEKQELGSVNCLDYGKSFQGIGKKNVSTLLMDSQSNLWVGTDNGIILYPGIDFDSRTIPSPHHFSYNSKDTSSLIENKVTHLMEDSNHNVWISTRNGLMTANIMQEEIQLKGVDAQELQQKVIYGVLEDKEGGRLWMSTNTGLYTYDLSTEKVDHFNAKDGLQGNEFNTYSYFQSKTGEMFFGGPNGLTYFNPKDIRLNEQAPPIWFTELTTLENKKVDLINFDKKETLFLDYKERTFSIRFIGLDFFQPEELQYIYELEGETDLQKASLGNSRQINFSQLRPGDYSLLIKAINKDGAYSEQGDLLHFTIRAPFWKMMWFYLLITGLVISFFWLIFYLRYRNKMKRLEAIESVRRSIAEDFHDEMGSKLSIISMYSEFTKSELADQGGKAALYIDKVTTTASRLYDNTRDLIWVLNPKNDSIYDLYLQLKDFGEELLKDTGINFLSSGIPDELKNQNLPIRYQRHLLLIFKEAMHNSLKHSSCKNIKLSVKQQKHGLTFILEDDGQGFDTAELYKGDGLKNMRHRAKQMNSELHFVSNKEGTRIWLDIKS